MKQKISVKIQRIPEIFLELTDKFSPKTFEQVLQNLPFSVKLHVWGDEIYTSESPVTMKEENPRSIVSLNDVAYWPSGKALCLFYGPTPLGKGNEIKPYSPVNIIGKIMNPDKSIIKKAEGKTAEFRSRNN